MTQESIPPQEGTGTSLAKSPAQRVARRNNRSANYLNQFVLPDAVQPGELNDNTGPLAYLHELYEFASRLDAKADSAITLDERRPDIASLAMDDASLKRVFPALRKVIALLEDTVREVDFVDPGSPQTPESQLTLQEKLASASFPPSLPFHFHFERVKEVLRLRKLSIWDVVRKTDYDYPNFTFGNSRSASLRAAMTMSSGFAPELRDLLTAETDATSTAAELREYAAHLPFATETTPDLADADTLRRLLGLSRKQLRQLLAVYKPVPAGMDGSSQWAVVSSDNGAPGSSAATGADFGAVFINNAATPVYLQNAEGGSDPHLVNATDVHYDRLVRVLRLHHALKLPFAEVDMLVMAALRAEGQTTDFHITPTTLRALGMFQHLRETYAVNAAQFSAFIGTIAVHAPGRETPFYDTLFNPRHIERRYDSEPVLTMDGRTFAIDGDDEDSRLTVAQLSEATGANESTIRWALKRVNEAQGDSAASARTLDVVSACYRLVTLPRVFGIAPGQVEPFLTMLSRDNPEVLTQLAGRPTLTAPPVPAEVSGDANLFDPGAWIAATTEEEAEADPDILDVIALVMNTAEWLQEHRLPVGIISRCLVPPPWAEPDPRWLKALQQALMDRRHPESDDNSEEAIASRSIKNALNLSSSALALPLLRWANKDVAAFTRMLEAYEAGRPPSAPTADGQKEEVYPAALNPDDVHLFNGLAQRALLAQALHLSAEALSALAANPAWFTLNSESAHVRTLDLTTLYQLTRYRDWVGMLAESTNENQALAYLQSVHTDRSIEPAQHAQALAQLTGWAASDIHTLARDIESEYAEETVEDVADIDFLMRMHDLARKTGLSIASLQSLGELKFATGQAAFALAATRMLAACTQEEALTIEGLHGERWRDALAAWLLAHWAPPRPRRAHITDTEGLSEHLLTDIQVGREPTTSLVASAIASVQTYIHRVLSSLEEGHEKNLAIDEKTRAQWSDSLVRYGRWKMLRQLRNYPENHIDPTRRVRKTKPFADLENLLAQGKLNTADIQAALLAYLTVFERTSNIQTLTAYHDGVDPLRDTYHFIGKSNVEPATYHWRTLDMSVRDSSNAPSMLAWSEWEPVSVPVQGVITQTPLPSDDDIKALPVDDLTRSALKEDMRTSIDTIRPVVIDGRKYVFWVERDATGLPLLAEGKVSPFFAFRVRYARQEIDGLWSSPNTIINLDGTSPYKSSPPKQQAKDDPLTDAMDHYMSSKNRYAKTRDIPWGLVVMVNSEGPRRKDPWVTVLLSQLADRKEDDDALKVDGLASWSRTVSYYIASRDLMLLEPRDLDTDVIIHDVFPTIAKESALLKQRPIEYKLVKDWQKHFNDPRVIQHRYAGNVVELDQREAARGAYETTGDAAVAEVRTFHDLADKPLGKGMLSGALRDDREFIDLVAGYEGVWPTKSQSRASAGSVRTAGRYTATHYIRYFNTVIKLIATEVEKTEEHRKFAIEIEARLPDDMPANCDLDLAFERGTRTDGSTMSKSTTGRLGVTRPVTDGSAVQHIFVPAAKEGAKGTTFNVKATIIETNPVAFPQSPETAGAVIKLNFAPDPQILADAPKPMPGGHRYTATYSAKTLNATFKVTATEVEKVSGNLIRLAISAEAEFPGGDPSDIAGYALEFRHVVQHLGGKIQTGDRAYVATSSNVAEALKQRQDPMLQYIDYPPMAEQRGLAVSIVSVPLLEPGKSGQRIPLQDLEWTDLIFWRNPETDIAQPETQTPAGEQPKDKATIASPLFGEVRLVLRGGPPEGAPKIILTADDISVLDRNGLKGVADAIESNRDKFLALRNALAREQWWPHDLFFWVLLGHSVFRREDTWYPTSYCINLALSFNRQNVADQFILRKTTFVNNVPGISTYKLASLMYRHPDTFARLMTAAQLGDAVLAEATVSLDGSDRSKALSVRYPVDKSTNPHIFRLDVFAKLGEKEELLGTLTRQYILKDRTVTASDGRTTTVDDAVPTTYLLQNRHQIHYLDLTEAAKRRTGTPDALPDHATALRLNTLIGTRFAALAGGSAQRLLAWETQMLPVPRTAPGTEDGTIDFSGANGFYYWELFMHLPMVVAWKLRSTRQYQEAFEWSSRHLFDPYDAAGQPDKLMPPFWHCRPLTLPNAPLSLDAEALTTEVDTIAYAEPERYRKAALLFVVELWRQQGDDFYRQLTRDGLTEASSCYRKAQTLLGPLPERLTAPTPSLPELTDTKDEHFLPPVNTALTDLRDLLDSRLFNLRHGLTIDGKILHLDLYDSADDFDLLGAHRTGMASGASAKPRLDVPPYRFKHIMPIAKDAVQQLIDMGRQVFHNYEEQYNAGLSVMQQANLITLSDFTLKLQEEALAQVRASKQTLLKSKEMARQKQRFYQKHFASDPADLAMSNLLTTEAASINATAMAMRMTAAGIKNFPTIFGTAAGNADPADLAQAVADIIGFAKDDRLLFRDELRYFYDRRVQKEEWGFNVEEAVCEMEVIDLQLEELEIQIKAAAMAVDEINRRRDLMAEEYTFMTTGFAIGPTYDWMIKYLSDIYASAYDAVMSLCLAVQDSWRYETGDIKAQFIGRGAWIDDWRGMLAGDSLQRDLARMEAAYVQGHERRMHIRKSVSLKSLGRNPAASDLKTAFGLKAGDQGISFQLTPASYDSDFPGHYLRQIVSVGVTCKMASSSVDTFSAVLEQTRNRILFKDDIKGAAYLRDATKGSGDNVADDLRPQQQTAVSTRSPVVDVDGYNALFALVFSDGRYLPFEGTGAISDWRLWFPKEWPEGLEDIVLTIDYTAAGVSEATMANFESDLAAVEPAPRLSPPSTGTSSSKAPDSTPGRTPAPAPGPAPATATARDGAPPSVLVYRRADGSRNLKMVVPPQASWAQGMTFTTNWRNTVTDSTVYGHGQSVLEKAGSATSFSDKRFAVLPEKAELLYTVHAGGTTAKSDVLNIRLVDPNQLVLPTPRVDEVVANRALDRRDVRNGATLTIPAWPFMQAGQMVWVRCEGSRADGSTTGPWDVRLPSEPLTADEAKGDLRLTLPYDRIDAIGDFGSLKVVAKVSLDGTASEATADGFPELVLFIPRCTDLTLSDLKAGVVHRFDWTSSKDQSDETHKYGFVSPDPATGPAVLTLKGTKKRFTVAVQGKKTGPRQLCLRAARMFEAKKTVLYEADSVETGPEVESTHHLNLKVSFTPGENAGLPSDTYSGTMPLHLIGWLGSRVMESVRIRIDAAFVAGK